MDGTRYTITLEEFRLFHSIDRALFVILLRDLGRLPSECMYIIGLWLWLERAGFSSFISKVLRLPPFLINDLADEAMACLGCLHPRFPPPPENFEIPLTLGVGQKDISLQFFQENRLTVLPEIANLVKGVCIPTMSDILQNVPPGYVNNSTQAPLPTQPPIPTQPSIMGPGCPNQAWAPNCPLMGDHSPNCSMMGITPPQGRPRRYVMSREEEDRLERTMFVTFSKGYPVSEAEVRRFFARKYGNCVESFHMQVVRHNEQALYARIVFHRPYFIGKILEGALKAKFNINGKHVWMRQFVRKPRVMR